MHYNIDTLVLIRVEAVHWTFYEQDIILIVLLQANAARLPGMAVYSREHGVTT